MFGPQKDGESQEPREPWRWESRPAGQQASAQRPLSKYCSRPRFPSLLQRLPTCQEAGPESARLGGRLGGPGRSEVGWRAVPPPVEGGSVYAPWFSLLGWLQRPLIRTALLGPGMDMRSSCFSDSNPLQPAWAGGFSRARGHSAESAAVTWGLEKTQLFITRNMTILRSMLWGIFVCFSRSWCYFFPGAYMLTPYPYKQACKVIGSSSRVCHNYCVFSTRYILMWFHLITTVLWDR